jgi:mono/diheme cytochrome c family protein
MNNITKILLSIFGILLVIGIYYINSSNKSIKIPNASNNDPRWFSSEQVKAGENIFNTNCVVCHGPKGKSTSAWRKTLADGSFPPPPLNGSAHTWHHTYSLLFKIIREGGKSYDGKMPAFKDKLTEQQTENVIAYFVSLWPDEQYNMWISNGGLKGK